MDNVIVTITAKEITTFQAAILNSRSLLIPFKMFPL